MRAVLHPLLLIALVGCSRQPSPDTFTAAPLPSSFMALRSPNGQRQVLLVRAGPRWQGHLDDTFASSSMIVVADSEFGLVPEYVRPDAADAPPVDISSWRRTAKTPAVIIDAWAAADPALRTEGPSAIVSIARLSGDSQSITAVNTFLAGELEGAVGLAPPPGDAPADPGAVASRVAIEAAVRAVIDEDTGTVTPTARVAILQIPVFLTDMFLAVEHFVFEDRGAKGGGSAVSRFTLQDLKSGEALDMDALLDAKAIERLNTAAESPVAWYPARPGVVLVFRTDGHGASKRVVAPWRDVLPLLAEDSPLRAVADSVH